MRSKRTTAVVLAAILVASTTALAPPVQRPADTVAQARTSMAAGISLIRDTLVVQLVDQTARGRSLVEWTALVSALVALIAVVVGPWSAFAVARLQIRASVVSANRQVWINTLRDQLAELDAMFLDIAAGLKRGNVTLEEKLQVFHTTLVIAGKIKLLLNPHEEDHKTLLNHIRAATDLARAGNEIPKLNAERKAIVKIAQIVLKREWERVKAGG